MKNPTDNKSHVIKRKINVGIGFDEMSLPTTDAMDSKIGLSSRVNFLDQDGQHENSSDESSISDSERHSNGKKLLQSKDKIKESKSNAYNVKISKEKSKK